MCSPLLQGATSTARHRRLGALAHRYSARRRLASSSTRKERRKKQFLTPGFQPTAIAGDNCGFYSGSTFYEGAPPGPLPSLHLAAVLSPGRYCKSSSWTPIHHTQHGTKDGTHAAQRLVEARRELTEVIRSELQSNSGEEETAGRKLYALTGHGVPGGLLCQLTDAARGWLSHSLQETAHARSGEGRPHQQLLNPSLLVRPEGGEPSPSPLTRMSFRNVPNATLLDQSGIRIVDAHGAARTLASLPNEWERDLEMYMVVMDRMGSRLATLANPCPLRLEPDEVKEDASATLGAGSVIMPSQLKQWDVTMMRGEALPMSLLPNYSLGRSDHRGNHKDGPKLTMEWVKDERGGRWNVVLRLQDGGYDMDEGHGGPREPISLVFEGCYDAP
ncbi:hypothetical protein ACHAXT_005747 [Thalassiosira profunda]